MSDEYAGERGVPNAPICKAMAAMALLFDAYCRKLLSGGAVVHDRHARSGQRNGAGLFNYSRSRQKLRGIGPIPEGEYWLLPAELAEQPTWYEVWRSECSRSRTTV